MVHRILQFKMLVMLPSAMFEPRRQSLEVLHDGVIKLTTTKLQSARFTVKTTTIPYCLQSRTLRSKLMNTSLANPFAVVRLLTNPNIFRHEHSNSSTAAQQPQRRTRDDLDNKAETWQNRARKKTLKSDINNSPRRRNCDCKNQKISLPAPKL